MPKWRYYRIIWRDWEGGGTWLLSVGGSTQLQMNRSFGWVCWSGGSTRLFDVISGVVVQEYLVVAVVVPLQMNWSFWLICWSGGTTGLFGVIGGVVVQDYWVVVVQLQMNRSFRIAEVMVIRIIWCMVLRLLAYHQGSISNIYSN